MQDDPFDTRDRGLRRVHTVTASVAAAALVGTGVIVYEFAAPSTASAEQTVPQSGDDQQVAPEQGDDGPVAPQFGTGNGSGGIQPPSQLPVPAPRGRSHASSGGS